MRAFIRALMLIESEQVMYLRLLSERYEQIINEIKNAKDGTEEDRNQ